MLVFKTHLTDILVLQFYLQFLVSQKVEWEAEPSVIRLGFCRTTLDPNHQFPIMSAEVHQKNYRFPKTQPTDCKKASYYNLLLDA